MISIRDANANDLGTIVHFQELMALETENFQLDHTTVSAGVNAVFYDPSKGNYLVAESQGNPVGSLLLTPEWSDWRNGTFVWIQSVYVLPEFRGKGIFSLMYDFVKQKALNDENIKGLRLYVVHTNTRAQHVYKAMGMKSGYYDFYEWIKE